MKTPGAMSPWLMRIGIWLLLAALVGRRVTDVSRTRGNRRTREDTRGHDELGD